MNKKLLLGICILGCIGAFWYYSKAKKYHTPIAIQFGRKNTPYTEVKIEGKSFLLNLDLGSKFSVDIREDVLKEIDEKKFHGMGKWRIPNGNEYEAPNYTIPKMTLGNLVFTDVIVQQLSSESMINQVVWSEGGPEAKKNLASIGSIGRPLLQKFNMLVDYSKEEITATNDLKKIEKMGYFIDQMHKISFSIGLMGINVQMDTKWGVRNFSIDTGSSINLIRSSILEELEGTMTQMGVNMVESSCHINEHELGDFIFYSYDLTPDLSDIDGILGTPFLDQLVLYIDFQNKILYFKKN